MREFGCFVGKQFICALFPLFIFGCAILTAHWTPIPRYDLLLGLCILAQVALIWTKLETMLELKMICAFHLAGLMLELFKVRHGSWTYPGEAYTKLLGVPLFSGFMYASIASYMIQAWRRFDLRFSGFPKWSAIIVIGLGIYANFFLSKYIGDRRVFIAPLVLVVFRHTWVHFRPSFEESGPHRRMPMSVAFVLIGFFVWIAEHICTYLRIWQYPNQVLGWQPVTLGKLGSWCLLVIVSFLLVANTKRETLLASRQGTLP
ncbi:MAG: DUF817 domain-containing protein [Fimbriimonadaceae bacterium]